MFINSPFIRPSRGRPKKNPHEIVERIRIALIYGYSLQRACKMVGLNRKTVYNAMKNNQWLSEEVEKYRNLPPEKVIEFRSKFDFM